MLHILSCISVSSCGCLMCCWKIYRLYCQCSELDWNQSSETELEKTQLIWIGTKYELAKIAVDELQLQSTYVPFCSAVADCWSCRSCWVYVFRPCDQSVPVMLCQLCQLQMNPIATDTCGQTEPGTQLHKQSSWLLQQLAVWYAGGALEETSKCA